MRPPLPSSNCQIDASVVCIRNLSQVFGVAGRPGCPDRGSLIQGQVRTGRPSLLATSSSRELTTGAVRIVDDPSVLCYHCRSLPRLRLFSLPTYPPFSPYTRNANITRVSRDRLTDLFCLAALCRNVAAVLSYVRAREGHESETCCPLVSLNLY